RSKRDWSADVCSSDLSAAALLAMRARPGARRPSGGSVAREIREGLVYVRANVWLWGTFLAASFAYLLFMGSAEVLLPYLVKNERSEERSVGKEGEGRG